MGGEILEETDANRRRFIFATSFVIYSASAVILDIAVVAHGGPVSVTFGLAMMAVACLLAARATYVGDRKLVWLSAGTAILGIGMATALVGVLSQVDQPVAGYVLGGSVGLAFWSSALLTFRRWTKSRIRGQGTQNYGQ